MRRPDIRQPTPDALAEAAAHLRAGRLVAFPTETVYGLGADATDDRAVAAVFAAKFRPRFNPLIVHFATAEAAHGAADFDGRAERLALAFWPGALTLVLRRRPGSRVSGLATAGLDTVAVRVPNHPVARELLALVARPLAAPSANASGAVSPTDAEAVAESLDGRVAVVLDGGRCPIGLESTVVDLSGGEPRLLRPGGVAAEDVEAVVGALARDGGGPAKSPGLVGRHYAPSVPLRPNAAEVRPGEALLAFGPAPPPGTPVRMLNLSPSGDLEEAAANFFAMLRALDQPGHAAIAVAPIPGHGLGLAINDRLGRASAGD
jgi:L-threonylcarbamoyladenylate synthase